MSSETWAVPQSLLRNEPREVVSGYEYRVVDKDGNTSDFHYAAKENAEWYCRGIDEEPDYYKKQPHRVERRSVGVWEQVSEANKGET